ncbi:MAG: 3-phosphoshikimate 1-carboxyvinyltransferase, partial [Candidatus Bathyarchaeia archaeon]
MDLTISPCSSVSGTVEAPSSKSYTHRAVIACSLTMGNSSWITNPLWADDTHATLDACSALGVEAKVE